MCALWRTDLCQIALSIFHAYASLFSSSTSKLEFFPASFAAIAENKMVSQYRRSAFKTKLV